MFRLTLATGRIVQKYYLCDPPITKGSACQALSPLLNPLLGSVSTTFDERYRWVEPAGRCEMEELRAVAKLAMDESRSPLPALAGRDRYYREDWIDAGTLPGRAPNASSECHSPGRRHEHRLRQ